MNEHDKVTLDAIAYSAFIAALMKWLPVGVMALTFIWTAIRIYETATFQKMLAWIRSKLP